MNKGTVIHAPTNGPNATSQWESTSNLHTANKLFGIENDYLGNRMKWAATYEYLFLQRNEPRSMRSLPEFEIKNNGKEWTQEDVERQAKLPLNEHMQIQVRFYCKQMKIKPCPVFTNQGEASKFMMEMAPKYLKHIQSIHKI